MKTDPTYEMEDSSTTAQEIEGFINLNLAVILQACIDGDKEWLLSSQFNAMIMSLPDKIIQRELGVGLITMTPRQIGKLLIRKIEQGVFRGRKCVY